MFTARYGLGLFYIIRVNLPHLVLTSSSTCRAKGGSSAVFEMGRTTEGVAVPCATTAYEFVNITAQDRGEVAVGVLTFWHRSFTFNSNKSPT